MMVKEAGMSFEPVISEMDLSYSSRYKVSHSISQIKLICLCIVFHTITVYNYDILNVIQNTNIAIFAKILLRF